MKTMGCLLILAASSDQLCAQAQVFDSVMQWRSIGPFRGGRSLAVAGHSSQPNTWYFGATGGGVWKSYDAGEHWQNVSDGYFKYSSVGSLAVAPSDPNVVVAGMGEAEIRGNCATGDGVYRSTDGGLSWKHCGLEGTQTIGAIAIHPLDANVMLVAALGHTFDAHPDRGVYRSTNGGQSWEHVIALDDTTGAIDVQYDPLNPRIVYAGTYSARRTPYSMSSGGKRSGLWKSTDGGEHWENISTKAGLPKGISGKVCIAPSRAQSGLIWAMIENENGGLFKSVDAGQNWSRVNQDKNIRQRPWYFSRVYAHPSNPDVVYVLNVGWWRSIDGGKSFQGMPSMHGDHHALWIDPNNAQRMILGDDGGAVVTYNGGQTWSKQDIPTGQFYHVNLDQQFPYRIYGDQQDNSSVCIASRTIGYTIGERDWFPAAGGESGYIVPHPQKPWIIFGGNYGGYLDRLDTKTNQSQDVSVSPENCIGSGAKDLQERFQWTFPIMFSNHDSSMLYACSQHVWRSSNEGMSWERISEDLTRNDSTKLQPSGGPITRDNTGVEVYCTIFALAESPRTRGILWAGSDDGLIHLSRDNGKSWTNVTPPKLPEWSLISIIEPSHFDDAEVFVAATRYKSGDTHPYLLHSTDYGQHWTFINEGIPENAFTRVVREDPLRRGLLYCGTETGIYCSFDNGSHWQSLQYNLPRTPIHDLAVHSREHDLVAATHGRGFWILDDLSPLRQLNDSVLRSTMHLFAPRHTYNISGGSYSSPTMESGTNAPSGVQLNYMLRDTSSEELILEILDARDSVVRRFSSIKDEKGEPRKTQKDFYEESARRVSRSQLPARQGMNHFVWDMRRRSITEVPEAVYWGGGPGGVSVPPGTYRARLKQGKNVSEQVFSIVKDPRINTTQADFEEQYTLCLAIASTADSVNKAINSITEMNKHISSWIGAASSMKDTTIASRLKKAAKPIQDSLSSIETMLIQRKAKAGQDALNHPLQLNNKILALKSTVESADAAPTRQARETYRSLQQRIDLQLERLKRVKDSDIPSLNTLIRELNIPAIPLENN